ncbi:tri1, partial [Symbiodinium necroappetens]
MDADSARRQAAEIEALQAIYAEDGEFELLQEPEEGLAAGASFRVRCPNPLGDVRVNLPTTYPAQGRPAFVLERLRGPAAEAVQLGLEALASEHATEECIFDVLTRAVEVAESAGLGLPEEAPVAAAKSINVEE